MNTQVIEMCRWCKHYRPDERYRGVIGMCAKKRTPTDVKSKCIDYKKGEQFWMNGEGVKNGR